MVFFTHHHHLILHSLFPSLPILHEFPEHVLILKSCAQGSEPSLGVACFQGTPFACAFAWCARRLSCQGARTHQPRSLAATLLSRQRVAPWRTTLVAQQSRHLSHARGASHVYVSGQQGCYALAWRRQLDILPVRLCGLMLSAALWR